MFIFVASNRIVVCVCNSMKKRMFEFILKVGLVYFIVVILFNSCQRSETDYTIGADLKDIYIPSFGKEIEITTRHDSWWIDHVQFIYGKDTTYVTRISRQDTVSYKNMKIWTSKCLINVNCSPNTSLLPCYCRILLQSADIYEYIYINQSGTTQEDIGH